MYKLSIIVPIYGVEKYLNTCLDSTYSQATDECQIILVDDQSPDKCGEICEEYKAKYPEHTTVIHQENRGLGGARNAGMERAQGEYLFFIDSDDYLPDDTIPHILHNIKRFGADVFVFPFNLVDEAGNILGKYRDDFVPKTPISVKDDKAVLTGIPSAWNKVCKTDLYRRLNITFPSRVWYEDIRTTPKLLSKADSVVFLEREMYNYLQREGSIMSSTKVERNVEIIEALEDLLDWFKKEGTYEEFREEIDYLIIDHVLVSATVRVLRSAGKKHPLIEQLRSFTKENCPSFTSGKNYYVKHRMPRSRKIIYSLLRKKMYSAVKLIFRIKK